MWVLSDLLYHFILSLRRDVSLHHFQKISPLPFLCALPSMAEMNKHAYRHAAMMFFFFLNVYINQFQHLQ